MIYQVPQFIDNDVKLMGLITFTQLWIILGFLGMALISFLIFPFWLAVFFAIILLVSGFFIAFGKMNGVPIYKLTIAAIRHFWLPKYYLWKKEKRSSNYFSSPEENPLTIVKPSSKKTYPKKNLDQDTLNKLTNLLDQ